MQRRKRFFASTVCAWSAAGLVAVATTAVAAESQDPSSQGSSTMDHSQMDHAQHNMQRDELGRSGFGMSHQMSPELIKELREKVSLYKDYSDAQIALSMDTMGAEYAWYISPANVKGSQGILILMHGFREQGDKIFKSQVQPIGNIFPTSLGIGMAMMMSSHIQTALDDLTAAGAKEIVVVPVVSSASNELFRQWLYIFGKQEKAEFATVPRVKTSASIRIMPPPGDDPLVAEILLDYANELSKDPKNEVVIIAGHGPSSAEDNAKEMKVLEGLSKIVRDDGGFSAVYGQTLQDDAPAEIREANVKKLRTRIEDATKSGKRVLIVTNLIGARTIQAKLRDDLKGLDYQFNAKGIVQHDNFIKWMNEGIRKELEHRAAL